MTKFVCPHGNIEVVKVAKFMPGFLNRQIILLLDHLGVPVSGQRPRYCSSAWSLWIDPCASPPGGRLLRLSDAAMHAHLDP